MSAHAACAPPEPDLPSPARTTRRVALVGNPNTGKTTVFNRLCGANAKTANFPGTTTAARVGRTTTGGDRSIEVVDLPGLYGLAPTTPEARMANDVLSGADLETRPDAVVVLVDATNLPRNLVLVGELLARDEHVIVALNMMDMARRRGIEIDVPALSRRLGAPVVATVASKGKGLDQLRAVLDQVMTGSVLFGRPDDLPAGVPSIHALTTWADDIAQAVRALHEAFDLGSDAVLREEPTGAEHRPRVTP